MTVRELRRRMRADEWLEWFAFDAWREDEREFARKKAEM